MVATEKKAKAEPMSQLNAEIPASLKKALKKHATETDTTLGKLVTKVLSEYMESMAKRGAGATGG